MEGDQGKILLVDDSWAVLERLRTSLSSKGYAVRLSTTPGEATRHTPWAELVVVDFHMPGMNGGELLPILREKADGALFYLYTSDADVGRTFPTLGFDGAFLKKGDDAALGPQVDATFRTIKLRQLAAQLRSARPKT